MGLKQINDADRIIFLKKFVEEILYNLSKDVIENKNIEVEKLRQKFSAPMDFDLDKRKSMIHRAYISEKTENYPAKMIQKPIQKQPIQLGVNPVFQIAPLNPFKKIEFLLRDPTIQLIECPGPGKNLLIKKYNKINATKVIFSQEEINKVIDDFSKEARVPVVGGILKAAVRNLVISAVISEFVGSRFIINKITPYSLIENRPSPE